MNVFNVFLPIIIATIYFLLIIFIPIIAFLLSTAIGYGIAIRKDAKKDDKFNEKKFMLFMNVLLIIVLFVGYISVFNMLSSAWIRVNQDVYNNSLIENAGSVIVFGFGLNEESSGKLLPGRANEKLQKWISNNINGKIIIGQYGNMLAWQENRDSNSFILMHEHTDSYINTYNAVKFALYKLDSLYSIGKINNNVIIVAHDMQLQRIAWILQEFSEKDANWQKYHFIIPNIHPITFSLKSVQFHTKCRFIYNCIELFYSRPRDYILTRLMQ